MSRDAVLADGPPVNDAPLLLPHGDPATEDRALHHGVALFDRGERGRLSLAGPKAAELLTGLVTSDVLALVPGTGQYAAMLSPKGKIVADLRIFAGVGSPDRLFVDTASRAGDALWSTIRKYVNPRLAPYRDERATVALLAACGPRARDVVAAATGLAPDALAALPPWSHVSAIVDEQPLTVVRTPELAVEGFDLLVPVAAARTVVARLVAEGAVPAGAATWDVARIEAGRPEWGLDIDDATIPQEANFDELGAISYTKGCYTGQETVARVHFRGHVNRHLRHLRFTGETFAPRGTQLLDETGKVVGDVRSGALSPRMGPVTLAMVRREVAPGTRLVARGDAGEHEAIVALLPYVASAG